MSDKRDNIVVVAFIRLTNGTQQQILSFSKAFRHLVVVVRLSLYYRIKLNETAHQIPLCDHPFRQERVVLAALQPFLGGKGDRTQMSRPHGDHHTSPRQCQLKWVPSRR